jgi:hypothetical protein
MGDAYFPSRAQGREEYYRVQREIKAKESRMTEHNMSRKKDPKNPIYLKHLETGDVFSRLTDGNAWLLCGHIYGEEARVYTVVAVYNPNETDLYMGMSYTYDGLVDVGYLSGPLTEIKRAAECNLEIVEDA